MTTFVRAFLLPAALVTAAGCGTSAPAPEAAVAAESVTVRAARSAADAPHVPGPCSIVYESDATIKGTVDQVWSTLTNLPNYGAWNPWLVSATGDLTPGGAVTAQVILNGKQQKAEHKVLTVNPKSDFCWRDAGFSSLFVYGQRCRWLTPHADGTVGYHVELLLDGPIDWLADWIDGAAMRDGMSAETAALKKYVESL
jgi:hypothetical protein